MAYGTKYHAFYKDVDGKRFEILLKKDGFAGEAIEWYTTLDGLKIESGGSDSLFGNIICPTQVRLGFLFEENYDLAEFVEDTRTFLVEVFSESESRTIFSGWLEPWDAQHEYRQPNYFVSLTASCGLARLSRSRFTLPDSPFYEFSYWEIAKVCLNSTGIVLDTRVSIFTALNSSPSTPNPLTSLKINVFRYYNTGGEWMDCETILKDILQKFNAEIFQSENRWVIRGIADHALGSNGYIEYPVGGGQSIVPAWPDTTLDVNSDAAKTLEGGSLSLSPPVRKYTTIVDFGLPVEKVLNGALQLWTNDGLLGWDFGLMPPGGGNGWRKTQTSSEQFPYALTIAGKAPQPYIKKKRLYPWQKKRTYFIEPSQYVQSPIIKVTRADKTITVSFEYYTKAQSSGFLYAIRISGHRLDTEWWADPGTGNAEVSERFKTLKAPPAPEINPETGAKNTKGKVEIVIQTEKLNHESKPNPNIEPYNSEIVVRFYKSIDEGLPGDEYTIYKFGAQEEGFTESSAEDGNYKTILQYNALENEEGDTINLISGDYNGQYMGSTFSIDGPTQKWRRRSNNETISIYRAMMLDRIAMTRKALNVFEGDIKLVSPDLDISFLKFLVFKDFEDRKFKIVRFSYEAYRRIATVTAVEVAYDQPMDINLTQDSYTSGRGKLNTDNNDGDGLYPTKDIPGGREGAEEKPIVEEEDLESARVGALFEGVDPLNYTVSVQSSDSVNLEDFFSELYLEDGEEDVLPEDRFDPSTFILSVVNKPDWISNIVFDGLIVTATGLAIKPGSYFIDVSMKLPDSIVTIPARIPVIAYDKTTIKYTLRDTSGPAPVVVGTITNGSGHAKPAQWDILATVTGNHTAWYGKLTGMGITVRQSNDPYTTVVPVNSATYIIGNDINSGVGVYLLNFATFRDQGNTNLDLIKRDIFKFTLYDEAYLNKAQFALWGAESNTLIGVINPNGSSAFNVTEPWDVKITIDGVQHNDAISDLTSDSGFADSTEYNSGGTTEDATYFQFGEVRNDLIADRYSLLLNLKLDNVLLYTRQIGFTINKEKVKPTGGLKLGSIPVNATNFELIDVLPEKGGSYELPDNWTVLSDATSLPYDWEGKQVYDFKNGALIEVNISSFTGEPQFKQYAKPVTQSDYLLFDDLNSTKIGGIHRTPSTFRVIFTRKLGGASGEVVAIYKSDFSFGDSVDIDDTPIADGEAGANIIPGDGMSEELVDGIRVFNVNVDNTSIDIDDDNQLRIKPGGIDWSKFPLLPGKHIIGNVSDNPALPTGVSLTDLVSVISPSLLVWNNITGKPTTVAGYGITDVYTKTEVNNLLTGYVPVSRTISINGVTFDLSQNRSWTVTTDSIPLEGSGLAGRLTVWTSATAVGSANQLYYSSGLLGIGVAVPTESVHVSGNVKASGSFISTIATGTAPVQVTSTTLNTNLNADLLDNQHGSYYLAWNNFTGKPTTVAGYGITDVYTQTQVNTLLAGYVPTSRSITAGTGLSGGGNLTIDRTLSFDTAWGDARYLTTISTALGWDNVNTDSKFKDNTSSVNGPIASVVHGIFIAHGSNSSFGTSLAFRNGAGYFRSIESGVWGAWKQIADRDWVTSMTVSAGAGLTSSPSTGSGVTLSFDTVFGDARYAPLSHVGPGVAPGTYRSVTVNAQGHVTAGTNPTTLAGYGITDVNLQSVLTAGNSATSQKMSIQGIGGSTGYIGRFGANDGWLEIGNGTSITSAFLPTLKGINVGASNVYGIAFIGQGQDTYSQGALLLSGRNALGTGMVTSGKILSVRNYTTEVFSIDYTGNTVASGVVTAIIGNSTQWNEAYTWGNYALKNVVAGNGLTGGGSLGTSPTLTLGTPSQITQSSTNSVSSTSHTHAIDKANLIAGANVSFSTPGIGVLLGLNNITVSVNSLPWTSITGKPTTPADYGIADPTLQSVLNTGNTATGQSLSVQGINGTVSYIGRFGANDGWLEFGNGTTFSSSFLPTLRGINSGTSNVYGVALIGQGQDSYSQGALLLSGRNALGTGAVTSGKILSVRNYTTEVFSVDYAGNTSASGVISAIVGNSTQWNEAYTWGNYALKNVVAGNGLTGGGGLATSPTLTLGTPSSITQTSTNSVSALSHTHAIDKANLIEGNNVTFTGSGVGVLLGTNNLTVNVNSLSWGSVTGKPTTLSGYGITDSYTQTQVTGLLAGYVPTSRTITINGVTFDLSQNRTWTISTSGGTIGGSGTANKFALWTGSQTIGDSILSVSGAEVTVDGQFVSNAAPISSNTRGLVLKNAGLTRWSIGKIGLESGSNGGSNLTFYRYDDTGVSMGVAFSINRATGVSTFNAPVTINGSAAPLIVTSTLLNTNLNADLLDGQHGSYYLAWSNFTGKPTTVSGYGITDVYTQTQVNTLLAGYVPTSRTITINGVTFDLSQNRSWTIATGTGTLTGSGVAGKLGVWTNGTTINAGDQLFYSAGFLGLATSTPDERLDVAGNIKTSGSLISSLVTGTAPIQVSSTTLNTNLNADLLDNQHGSYYLAWNNLTGKPSTVAGYGISDVYTQTQVNSLLSGYVPTGRVLTINGVSYDLTQNRSWTISGGSGGATISGGTKNRLAKFNIAGDNIVDSKIYELNSVNGDTVGVLADLDVSGVSNPFGGLKLPSGTFENRPVTAEVGQIYYTEGNPGSVAIYTSAGEWKRLEWFGL